MELGLIYELANKENIFLLIAGFVFGFSLGYAWGKSRKKAHFIEKGSYCPLYYKRTGKTIGFSVLYKNGKVVGNTCPHRKKRFFKCAFCKELCEECYYD